MGLADGLVYLERHLACVWGGERVEYGHGNTSRASLPMEAVDANVVGDRWLLVTIAGEVLKFDVDLIDRSAPGDSRNGEIREVIAEKLTPDWQVHSVQQRSRQLAGAV